MDDDEDERSAQVRGALFKVLGLLVAVAVLIWLGSMFMVNALGLNQDSGSSPIGSATAPTTPLPTTALPVPSDSASPSDEPSPSSTPSQGARGDIELEVSPVTADPNQRVNFTGTYPKADNVPLEVQRYDNGSWTNFGVQVTVRVGTFETYIMTSRAGENRFRVWDPAAKKGSNVILVTIT